MIHRGFYLQRVILLLKSEAHKQYFAKIISVLASKDIEIECHILSQPFYIEEKDRATLYISDSGDIARQYLAKGEAVLGYCHQENREEFFGNVLYLMESPGEIEAFYLERIYRRCKGLPWNILETKRCYVRESCLEDVDAFYKLYKNPKVHRYIGALYEDIEEEKQYMQAYIKNMYGYYEFGIWTVIEKESGEIIGRAGLELPEDSEVPQLGYVLATDWQKKGLAEEVCKAILQYAREELELEAIQVKIHVANGASIKLARKLGFELREVCGETRCECKDLKQNI